MADHSWGNAALCILPQSAQGTVNSTITGLTTTVATADGLVIGVGDKGEGGTGIEMPEHQRVGQELARIGNSAQADQFLREVAANMKLIFPLAGGRNTAGNPTVDADFNLATHFPGLDAILRACGLTGAAWGSGVGHEYTPSGAATYATVGLFFGGLKVVYLDVLVALDVEMEGGKSAVATASFDVGSIYSWGAQTLSTITQGNQATAAPVVQNTAASWGATRPPRTLSLSINPNITDTPDFNAANGRRRAQESIDVTFSAEIYAATSDPDFERDELVKTTAPTADLTMLVPGASTSNGGVANSYSLAINNNVPRTAKPRKFGSYLGWEVSGEAKAISTAGTELSLIFR